MLVEFTKIRFFLLSLSCGIGFFQLTCHTPKLAFDYPPNIVENQREEFESFFKKGYKIYQVNCASCHGKVYKSTDSANQFSDVQIRNYAVNLKIRNETHKFTRTMTKDDIDAVCVYLRYRK